MRFLAIEKRIGSVRLLKGISHNTISKGLKELEERDRQPRRSISPRLHREGAGRKRREQEDPEIKDALERLITPTTRGDPMSPLKWTCKSTYQLADELTRQGHVVKPRTVARLVKDNGYRLQSNRKSKEGIIKSFNLISRCVCQWLKIL